MYCFLIFPFSLIFFFKYGGCIGSGEYATGLILVIVNINIHYYINIHSFFFFVETEPSCGEVQATLTKVGCFNRPDVTEGD